MLKGVFLSQILTIVANVCLPSKLAIFRVYVKAQIVKIGFLHNFARSKENLQSILNDIELYCGIWGLNINTSKTKAMIFEKGRHTTCDLFLNNVKLVVVISSKMVTGTTRIFRITQSVLSV